MFRTPIRRILAAAAFAAALSPLALAGEGKKPRILYITTTAGFHHSACEYSVPIIQKMAETSGAFEVVCSDRTDLISPESLKGFDAICFSNTTGDLKQFPLSEANREALVEAVKGGKAFIGIHAATDTYKDWEPYYDMIGGSFIAHPWNEPVTITIEDPSHPAASPVPSPWTVKDEIYTFKNYSRDKIHVIMSMSDDSVKGRGNRPDGDYAIAWSKMYGKGRVFYTSLGHEHAVWDSPYYQKHLLGGIRWALGQVQTTLTIGHPRVEAKWTPIFDGKALAWGKDWEATDDPTESRKHWRVLPGGILQGMVPDDSKAGSSHLYYIAKEFGNFEVHADININAEGNSGFYFRCPKDKNVEKGQWKNWPAGYEAQINNGWDPDPKKSGTFYPEPNLSYADMQRILGYDKAKDDGNFWFRMTIIAVGKHHFVIKLNDTVVVDIDEAKFDRGYLPGLFAFQMHHKGAVVRFKNIEVRELCPGLK